VVDVLPGLARQFSEPRFYLRIHCDGGRCHDDSSKPFHLILARRSGFAQPDSGSVHRPALYAATRLRAADCAS
jgi:hypothetical protein